MTPSPGISSTAPDRYDRQRRLQEVGAEGQERIRASAARIVAGPEAATALAYLVRAGVERGSIVRAEAEPFPHAGRFRFRSSAAIAAGAHSALRHVLSALKAR